MHGQNKGDQVWQSQSASFIAAYLMIEGWPEKIKAAQHVLTYMIDGKPIPRVRYGDEQDDWKADTIPCHDCRVIKGEFRVPTCDVEECPVCHGQLLSCECPFDDLEDE